MPGTLPKTIWLYRIVHIRHVAHLLKHGLCYSEHQNADPSFISIGDSSLINNRRDYPVGVIPPGGTLGEYVPFYFGPHSPMLYRIKNGYGVLRQPQSDIVYVVCKLDDVVASCGEWCFTDGHAKTRITAFYNSLADLDKVHWDVVGAKQWSNTEDEEDRMRRKQAEFLVRFHVPVDCITGTLVYNEAASAEVQKELAALGITKQVVVHPKFYY